MAKKRVYGEGSITQRKDGRWQISVPGADGKRRYAYADTPKEAEKVRRKLLAEVEQGKLPPSKQPFRAHVQEWLDMKRKSKDYKPNTYLNAVSRFNAYFLPAFGHVPLNKLPSSHIQRLYSKMLDKGLSPNTVRDYHRVLNVCLASALKQGKIPNNPCDQVELPKKKKVKNNHLSREDALRLIEACKGHKLLGSLIPLALATEAREGELLALTWDDVDMERGLITINKTLTRAIDKKEATSLQTVPPKSESGIRTLLLPDFALEVLKEYRKKQVKSNRSSGVQNKHNLVFCGTKGEFIWPNSMFKQFKRIAIKLGLDICFHDLRHTGATLLLESGVFPITVQERLGHSDVRTTLGIYGHTTEKMRDQSRNTLDTLFTRERKEGPKAI